MARLVLEQEKLVALQQKNYALAMQSLQYENLQERIAEARQAKHDVRHHIALLQDCLRRKDYDAMQTYLDRYQETLPDARQLQFCGNAAVNAVLSYFAQQAAAQAAASVRAEGSDKLQQLTRKLEAAHAEIRRYQTRLFACERQMIALRRENADLEAACEQAREELQMAVARAEKAEQQAAQTPACPEVPVQAPTPEPPEEAVACCARPAAQPAAQPEPVWQPETELEKLSVELLRRFDEMMQE